jgi:hypothetical protein
MAGGGPAGEKAIFSKRLFLFIYSLPTGFNLEVLGEYLMSRITSGGGQETVRPISVPNSESHQNVSYANPVSPESIILHLKDMDYYKAKNKGNRPSYYVQIFQVLLKGMVNGRIQDNRLKLELIPKVVGDLAAAKKEENPELFFTILQALVEGVKNGSINRKEDILLVKEAFKMEIDGCKNMEAYRALEVEYAKYNKTDPEALQKNYNDLVKKWNQVR